MVNSRIPVTEEMRDRIKDFANGLNAQYEEALGFMLFKLGEPGERELLIGDRLRDEFQEWKQKQGDGDEV